MGEAIIPQHTLYLFHTTFMKNNLPLWILIAMMPILAHAQITIVETDLAQPGDVVYRYTDTLAVVTQGSGGANQTWNLGNAEVHLTTTTTVSTAASTPYGSAFASSNIAMTNDNASYLYFKQSASAQIATGIAGDFLGTGTPLNVVFNPELTVHNLPRTYGDGFTDTYGIDVTADGAAFNVYQVRFKRMATVVDSADGYGDVITPAGTFGALRTMHKEYLNDSIWIKLLPFAPFQLFDATKDTTHSYVWLAKTTKLAVAELTLDSLGNPDDFTWFTPSLVGIEDAQIPQLAVKMYPNPTTFDLHLVLGEGEIEGENHFRMWDINGKEVFSQTLSMLQNETYTLDVSALPSGFYTWQLQNAATHRSTQGKIQIAK